MRVNDSSMLFTVWEVRSTVEINKDCFRRVAPSFRGSHNHFQIKICGILVLWKSSPVYCLSQIKFDENTWQAGCQTSFWRNGETNVATHFHFLEFIVSPEFDVLEKFLSPLSYWIMQIVHNKLEHEFDKTCTGNVSSILFYLYTMSCSFLLLMVFCRFTSFCLRCVVNRQIH